MESSRHPSNFVTNERLGLMKICPYNRTHKVTVGRFGLHLLKCRREYQARQGLNGQGMNMLVCQYNHHHIVAAPELCYHEAECSDNSTIRSYQLNIVPLLEHLDVDRSLIYDLQSYRPDPPEQNELFGGLHLGQIIGTHTFGKPLPIDDLKRMNFEDEEEQRKLFRDQCHCEPVLHQNVDVVAEASGGQPKEASSSESQPEAPLSSGSQPKAASSSESQPKALGYSEDESKQENVEGAAAITAKDDDEEEDWGKECTGGPGFDYLKNIWNPNARHYHIPSGLTKSERKLFLKIHGKQLEERRMKAMAEYDAKRNIERHQVDQWQADWETFGSSLDPVTVKEDNATDNANKHDEHEQPGFENMKYDEQPGFENVKYDEQPSFENVKYAEHPGFENVKYDDPPGFRDGDFEYY